MKNDTKTQATNVNESKSLPLSEEKEHKDSIDSTTETSYEFEEKFGDFCWFYNNSETINENSFSMIWEINYEKRNEISIDEELAGLLYFMIGIYINRNNSDANEPDLADNVPEITDLAPFLYNLISEMKPMLSNTETISKSEFVKDIRKHLKSIGERKSIFQVK